MARAATAGTTRVRSARPASRWIWGMRGGNGTSRTLWRPPVRSKKGQRRTAGVRPVAHPVPSATSLREMSAPMEAYQL
jgi:hypothetical protein